MFFENLALIVCLNNKFLKFFIKMKIQLLFIGTKLILVYIECWNWNIYSISIKNNDI